MKIDLFQRVKLLFGIDLIRKYSEMLYGIHNKMS